MFKERKNSLAEMQKKPVEFFYFWQHLIQNCTIFWCLFKDTWWLSCIWWQISCVFFSLFLSCTIKLNNANTITQWMQTEQNIHINVLKSLWLLKCNQSLKNYINKKKTKIKVVSSQSFGFFFVLQFSVGEKSKKRSKCKIDWF